MSEEIYDRMWPFHAPQPWPRHTVRWRIYCREPQPYPWSLLDLVRGLIEVGRVHEWGFVTRISPPPPWAQIEPKVLAVDFYAPAGWRPQDDPSLHFTPYHAGGPGTRTWEGDPNTRDLEREAGL